MFKNLSILTMALAASVSCGKHSNMESGAQKASEMPTAHVAQSNEVNNEPGKTKEVPVAFKKVDFRNLSYPVGKTKVRLKDGTYELPAPRGGGGVTFSLRKVDYLDLTGDGADEAIVQLDWISCGGSCDGGTDGFYFYSVNSGKLSLLTRLEIGSFAYDCGLKTFRLKDRTLMLETFRSCRFTGSTFKPAHDDSQEQGAKLSTNRYTEFDLYFSGRKFVQKKRKVLRYPDIYDFRGHERTIEISDE